MLLCQHERHKVDFTKSSGTKDAVITVAIVFLIICAKRKTLGWEAEFGQSCVHKMFHRGPYSSLLDAIHE